MTANPPLAALPGLDSPIEVGETSVVGRDFVIESREVAAFLRSHPERTRRTMLLQALEVGAHCLECVSSTRDVDFVRTQLTELLGDVEGAGGSIRLARRPPWVARG